jgi:transcriptional regulator with XRE-family HTH domain
VNEIDSAFEKYLIRFGTVVRSLRKEKGLSQESLAQLSGLHRTYIGGIERGERNVSLKNISIICSALGISIADFLREVEK